MLMQRHPPGADGVIGALRPPRPSSLSHAGAVPQREVPPSCAGTAMRVTAGLLRGAAVAAGVTSVGCSCPAACLAEHVGKGRGCTKRERDPVVWGT